MRKNMSDGVLLSDGVLPAKTTKVTTLPSIL